MSLTRGLWFVIARAVKVCFVFTIAAEQIVKDIQQATFPIGNGLPSEFGLAEQMEVSGSVAVCAGIWSLRSVVLGLERTKPKEENVILIRSEWN